MPGTIEQLCQNTDIFLKEAKDRFQILPLVKGIDDNKKVLMIMWVNPLSGSWILTNRYPNGYGENKQDIICVFGSGINSSSVFNESFYPNIEEENPIYI